MRLALLLFAALAAAPFLGFGAGHQLTLLAHGMILGIAALGLWLLVGGAGLVSLGHAAMLGIGAYAVVALDDLRITEAAVVVPVALLAAGLFALATGAVALRTTGVNFIMITLAFGQMAFSRPAPLRCMAAMTAIRSMAAPPWPGGAGWLTGWSSTSSVSACSGWLSW